MNKLASVVLRHLLIFVIAFALTAALRASAQQPVGIYGYDTGTQPDGGIVRKVQVDSQGRLVTTGGSSGGGTATSTDAGVSVTVPSCTVSQDFNTTVGTSSVTLSALAGRWMTRVCNSARNTGNPIITCTSDGTTPTIALTSVGETLEPGDCTVYTSGTAVRCISDTASTAVTSWDCR
jgi:hypothetical protein